MACSKLGRGHTGIDDMKSLHVYQSLPATRSKAVSAGSSRSSIKSPDENDDYQLRREHTFPDSRKYKKVLQPSVSLREQTPSSSKCTHIRIHRLVCKPECFPLLSRNMKFAKDIQTRCENLFPNLDTTNLPKTPGILDFVDLQLYIATEKDSDDNPKEVLSIMGSYRYEEISNVTDKCFQKDDTMVIPGHGFSCLVSFLPEAGHKIKPPEQSKVLHFTRNTETPVIRLEIANILGEELFTYAEEVQKRLDKETTNFPPEPERVSLLQNTKEAVTILLTRKRNRNDETSVTTEHKIPDDIASKLNRMKDDGVMAFGLFVDRFVVFLDENRSAKVKKDTTREVENICSKRDDLKIPLKVVTVPLNFLTETALEQGNEIRSGKTGGSIGMVTKAAKPIVTDITEEEVEATASNAEKRTNKNIVVALTAGHLFTDDDEAFFVKNGELERFGKCIASLHPSGDTKTMQYDIAVIEADENMEINEDCSLKFKNETEESCDCILFKGTLACGTVMYKKGAVTKMTQGVVVSTDFRLAGLINTEKGYLIKGRDGGVFSGPGDSGSIVFTLADQDAENSVNLVSIVSKMMPKNVTSKLGYPVPLSYTVRLDRCLDKLQELMGVKVKMPEK